MKKEIKIAKYQGRYFLIGSDGYTTTQRIWKRKGEAEKARVREQRLEDAEKPSNMIWVY